MLTPRQQEDRAMRSPSIIRATVRGGVPGWLHPETGRFLPIIAGADGEGEGAEGDTPVAPVAIIVPPGTGDEPKPDEQLQAAGKAALDSERTARKAAEKTARETAAKLKQLEDASLTETERLKREADEGKQLAASATGKLRRANLLTALGEEGFTGARTKAVARLIDNVEYDDGDEPTNLKQALKAAEREYGELVKPKPVATDFDGGARRRPPGTSSDMDAQIRAMAGRRG